MDYDIETRKPRLARRTADTARLRRRLKVPQEFCEFRRLATRLAWSLLRKACLTGLVIQGFLTGDWLTRYISTYSVYLIRQCRVVARFY